MFYSIISCFLLGVLLAYIVVGFLERKRELEGKQEACTRIGEKLVSSLEKIVSGLLEDLQEAYSKFSLSAVLIYIPLGLFLLILVSMAFICYLGGRVIHSLVSGDEND